MNFDVEFNDHLNDPPLVFISSSELVNKWLINFNEYTHRIPIRNPSAGVMFYFIYRYKQLIYG